MANSENLTPFKKGQSGNPKGRPAITTEAKLIRRAGKSEVIKLIDEHLVQSGRLKKAIIEVSKKAEKGDLFALNFLLERMVGKVPQAPAEPLS